MCRLQSNLPCAMKCALLNAHYQPVDSDYNCYQCLSTVNCSILDFSKLNRSKCEWTTRASASSLRKADSFCMMLMICRYVQRCCCCLRKCPELRRHVLQSWPKYIPCQAPHILTHISRVIAKMPPRIALSTPLSVSNRKSLFQDLRTYPK